MKLSGANYLSQQIKTPKSRGLRFVVDGKEETQIVVRERYTKSYGSDNSYQRESERDTTYTASDIFYNQDLFAFISNNAPYIKKSDEETTIIKGKHETPFEFAIPSNTLASYSGKNAWIKYTVKDTIDKKTKRRSK